ncbi:hypothetical protein [Sphingopyxis microcysteis]|uniref:hypothetical protein n=1 Tax=Sphingopyxis microcysteis TaxID=2484145 RepID=UPI0014466ECD|nr:hypothetical protein [Sphingopyxis microcysteis]
MSIAAASFLAVVLNCTGTVSSAPLWSESASEFQLIVEPGDFFGVKGPFENAFDDRKVSGSADGSRTLTAKLPDSPGATFSGRLGSLYEESPFVWQVVEITSKDGRGTLQIDGKATCKSDNQVSAQ